MFFSLFLGFLKAKPSFRVVTYNTTGIWLQLNVKCLQSNQSVKGNIGLSKRPITGDTCQKDMCFMTGKSFFSQYVFKGESYNTRSTHNHQKPCFGYLKTRFFGGGHLCFSIGLAGAPDRYQSFGHPSIAAAARSRSWSLCLEREKSPALKQIDLVLLSFLLVF